MEREELIETVQRLAQRLEKRERSYDDDEERDETVVFEVTSELMFNVATTLELMQAEINELKDPACQP